MTDGRPARVLRLLLGHPLAAALRAAAARGACHLVGGALRDRLLGLPARDIDAVVERDGAEIGAPGAEPARSPGRSRPRRLRRLAAGGAGLRAGPVGPPGDAAGRRTVFRAARLHRQLVCIGSPTGELTDPHRGLADLGRRVLRATTRTSSPPIRCACCDCPVSRRNCRVRGRPGERGSCSAPGFPRSTRTPRNGSARSCGSSSRAMTHRGRSPCSRPSISIRASGWDGRAALATRAPRVGRLERLETRRRRLRELAQMRPRSTSSPPGGRCRSWVSPRAGPRPSRPRAASRPLAICRARRSERVLRAAGQQSLPVAAATQRTWLHGLGDLWPTAAVVAGSAAQSDEEQARWERGIEQLAGLARDLGAAIFAPPPLLNGDEVQRILGLPPGPAIGQALAALREAQVAGRVEDRDAAERLVRVSSGSPGDGGGLTAGSAQPPRGGGPSEGIPRSITGGARAPHRTRRSGRDYAVSPPLGAVAPGPCIRAGLACSMPLIQTGTNAAIDRSARSMAASSSARCRLGASSPIRIAQARSASASSGNPRSTSIRRRVSQPRA